VKALITGANGQLGRCLQMTVPVAVSAIFCTRSQLDLVNDASIERVLNDTQPDVVINAAAYTAVDRAETDRDAAFAANDTAVAVLARCCRANRARLIHLSTDYVFDGGSSVAYETDAVTHPINVYGESKLAGERRIVANDGLEWTIVRTSWVHSPHGRNFVSTMLRLMRERDSVSVVADQIGVPTSALSLARFVWHIAARVHRDGILHFTDGGDASWYDFAVAISEEATAAKLLPRPATVKPIATRDYPTPARRPQFSILATQASLDRVPFPQVHWREALREVLRNIRSTAIE